ncbi:hypothetical protein K504DRAFT_91446 [Pleomassaria siparia CBS 279.74]|uniref:Uncharacterized protein n=1 Tax=Pleomassaria siparia CBS 279.74 TaxID=1314801 RepID=A0A6G1JZ88_9PLEO|nr:hypothetical protein K504DRAFT_91446 [Pleomassaria siparia CBS 279.74]
MTKYARLAILTLADIGIFAARCESYFLVTARSPTRLILTRFLSSIQRYTQHIIHTLCLRSEHHPPSSISDSPPL